MRNADIDAWLASPSLHEHECYRLFLKISDYYLSFVRYFFPRLKLMNRQGVLLFKAQSVNVVPEFSCNTEHSSGKQSDQGTWCGGGGGTACGLKTCLIIKRSMVCEQPKNPHHFANLHILNNFTPYNNKYNIYNIK